MYNLVLLALILLDAVHKRMDRIQLISEEINLLQRTFLVTQFVDDLVLLVKFVSAQSIQDAAFAVLLPNTHRRMIRKVKQGIRKVLLFLTFTSNKFEP